MLIAPTLLELFDFEPRVASDGITQFSPEALHTTQVERSISAHRASQSQRSLAWVLASWNVRTLLDVEGPIETARQGDDMQLVDEQKIDQVADELGRYKIDMAALQGTKWFGKLCIELGRVLY